MEGESLSPRLRALYEHALDRFPRLWDHYIAERAVLRKNLTLVHGDCYLSQFLCPRAGAGQTYITDFEGAFADFPTMDLTRLFATFWTRRQRCEGDRERRLMRRYLAGLASKGVVEYSWDQLQNDYRLLLMYMIFYPVEDCMNGSAQSYWVPKLQCLTSAYEDWDCARLLT
jgi:hypothetical protein